ncbi:uncharacterized protein GGS25DRAFT_529226 [Hypoxylon fragiforme]|uniref:uncharacterized protein n=1 Tax=Hypoxylon fragiforme TaxID=63214 RepID=UPI0020C67939|nr:uncharacterized protein GGS25DRAFT_529226 [Hypoxylon fragiforme]KAI2612572.1 hypothetical protein GGS25DRAFT_529226 [Hypoxylon fragiforme]
MTDILRTTRGSDGRQTTQTITLPPQTTPFAPPQPQHHNSNSDSNSDDSDSNQNTDNTAMPPSCSLSVFCPHVSQLTFSRATSAHWPHLLQSQACLAVQTTTALWTAGSTVRTVTAVGYNADCWPPNYFSVFDNEEGVLRGVGPDDDDGEGGGGGTAQVVVVGDVSTAAFPGSECLRGWTTACATAVTESSSSGSGSGGGGKTYPQAWCCPPGDWSCATASTTTTAAANGKRKAGEPPQRLCRSTLTGPDTQIWMSWDPPYTDASREAYTWSVDVPGETDPALAAVVYRKVFPLALTVDAGTDAAAAAAAATTTTETATVTRQQNGGGGDGDGDGKVVAATATSGAGVARRAEILPLPLPLAGGRAMLVSSSSSSSRCAATGLLGVVAVAALLVVVLVLGFVVVVVWRKRGVGRCCEAGKMRKGKEEEMVLQTRDVKST